MDAAKIFNKAATDDSGRHYQNRDIIDIAYNGDTIGPNKIGFGRAINFNYILETGDIPIALNDNPNNRMDDALHINFEADDSYANALRDVTRQTTQDIQNNGTLSALLEKGSWTKEDRISWEEGVSRIVSRNMHEVEGLDEYRVETGESDVRRVTNLNDVSKDIDSGSRVIEYDCESMSAFEGVVMQRMDNHFLPKDAPESHASFKQAGSYFFVSARADTQMDETASASSSFGHMFIMSSVTGSIVEATIKGETNPYMRPADENYGFEDFINSKPQLYGNDAANVIYSGYATLALGEYKYENGFGQEVSAAPQQSYYDMLIDKMPYDSDFQENPELWPQTRHLSELKEQLVRVEEQMDLLPPDSPHHDDLKEVENDLKEDFIETFQSCGQSAHILIDYIDQYNQDKEQTQLLAQQQHPENTAAQGRGYAATVQDPLSGPT